MVNIAIQNPVNIHTNFSKKENKIKKVNLEALIVDTPNVVFYRASDVRDSDISINKNRQEVSQFKKIIDNIEIDAKSDGYQYSINAVITSKPVFTKRDKKDFGNGFALDKIASDNYNISAGFESDGYRLGKLINKLSGNDWQKYVVKISAKGDNKEDNKKGYQKVNTFENFIYDFSEFSQVLEGAIKSVYSMLKSRDGHVSESDIDLRLMIASKDKHGNSRKKTQYQEVYDSFDVINLNNKTKLYMDEQNGEGKFKYKNIETGSVKPNKKITLNDYRVKEETFNPQKNYVFEINNKIKEGTKATNVSAINQSIVQTIALMDYAEQQISDKKKISDFKNYVNGELRQLYNKSREMEK